MNSLNSCGATDECEQSKLEFLFKLAGRKLVKNIVRDKLSEKIPELPPIVPPGPPTPNPPPPPLRPSTCLGSPCGALIDGEIKLGRCVVGTGGAEAACSRYGFAPFPENSNPIGCSRYSETYCHCCDTLAPVPPPVPPPIPPPIPPPPPPPPGPTPPPVPPPVFPPRPPEGQCGIFGSACVTYIEDVGTVFGTCFAKKYGDEAQPEIATCAEVGGVPALVARGCGGGSECICCVDGASLCAGTPSGNCGGGYCSCILTYNGGYWSRSYVRSSSCSLALARSLARSPGANCNNPIYQNPPYVSTSTDVPRPHAPTLVLTRASPFARYPGYDPPPSTGGGCRENMCNAFAAQQGFEGGASCCPFCSA